MNVITIYNEEDFNQFLKINDMITNDFKKRMDEIDHNSWAMRFDKRYLKKIDLKIIHRWINKIINYRIEQAYPKSITVYVWYDEMSKLLCINSISGSNAALPFGCAIEIVKSLDTILELCLHDLQSDEGISISPTDVAWDEEGDEIEWVQKVFYYSTPQ